MPLAGTAALTNFRAKARFVSTSKTPLGLKRFTVAMPIQSAGTTGIAAKAQRIASSDAFGATRFEQTKARTPQGYARAFNSISRELVGLPLTRIGDVVVEHDGPARDIDHAASAGEEGIRKVLDDLQPKAFGVAHGFIFSNGAGYIPIHTKFVRNSA